MRLLAGYNISMRKSGMAEVNVCEEHRLARFNLATAINAPVPNRLRPHPNATPAIHG